ncbi:MAG: sigma-54-dependent transcriptional regulator [Pyrinomonadaceae bacterium]
MQTLVIDDEPQLRGFVRHVLQDDGWEVSEAASAEEAFEMLREGNWSMVLCDVLMGGADGFSVLKRFKEELPQTKVVLMTGQGTAVGALDATAYGAYDYLLKPFTVEALQALSRAIKERLQNRPHQRLVSHRGARLNASDIDLVGRSAALIEVMKQVGRVAGTNLTVLLTGESGTGKEVVASALHQRSKRNEKPFVAVNCGAIPSQLIESELFGHTRGSFTGAEKERRGLWEEADGGTVFLDEITETTPAFQVKLLRALQEGEIRKVGSNQTQKVDVRVIAASNRDVEQEVKAGRFREDLFYRLNAVAIVLPPLRDRREDILPLAQCFARQIYSLNSTVTFSAEALSLMENYPWPGNIRELENAVVRAAAMCDGVIRPRDFPERVKNYIDQQMLTSEQIEALPAEAGEEWVSLAEVEGRYVRRLLEHMKGNKQATARVLGVDRKTLDRMIKRHNIDVINISFPSRAAYEAPPGMQPPTK